MKKNIGNTDRLIRIALSALLLIVSLLGVLSTTLNAVALVFAVILILTSFMSFCGLYALLGWNTCKVKS